jgi:epoxyqueuosine reductase
MKQPQDFPGEFFAAAGLNRQHVFALDTLPADLLLPLNVQANEQQLILLGHAGRRLWECVQAADFGGEHPIDDYTCATVDRCFSLFFPANHYRIVYPGPAPLGLQALGKLAGWHHASPFMIGVDRQWGSWFAYRAVVLADTAFSPTPAVDRNKSENTSPCLDCRERPCISSCPAGATGERFLLAACSTERLRSGSACALGCLARQACPVGSEHRYDEAQIRHSYAKSLAMLETWQGIR